MLTDAVLLDISQAQRQIDQLEAELRRLSQPVRVPVDIDVDQGIDELRRDVQGADAGFDNLNAELAETDRELDRVRNSADRAGRELEQTGRRGISSFNGMAVAAGAFGVALAAAVGVRAFIGFANDAVQAASAMAESTSKAGVVFGNFFGQIQKFSQTAPQALGLANQEALEFTATFGNLFVALGLSQEAAADLSPEIVQLGADLASFNNINVADALEKLRSGLVGEAEPLRALGVNINEALTTAKAFELGLVGVNGVVSEAAKVQARYALIVEQTSTAQGDFARTADGIANRQRTLNAEFENFKVAVGEALLPAFESIISQAPEILAALEGLVPTIQALGSSIASVEFTGFVTGLVDISRALVNIPGVIGAFKDDVLALGGDNHVLVLSQHTQDLVEQLRKGVDPAKALANNLADIGRADLTSDQLQETAAALIQITGLPENRLSDLALTLKNLGPDAGLTAETIKVLLAAIDGFRTLRPVENPFINFIEGEGIAGVAAGIDEFNIALESLDTQETVAKIGALADSFTTLAPAIEDLPGIMGAVNDALQTEGDEVLETLDGFIEDLQRKFTQQSEFQGNLALLHALGLDDLADTFEAAGLEASQALAEAIADPTKAAEAERLLEAQAAAEASVFKDAFNAELAGFIATLPVDVILQQIQIPQIQVALGIAPIGGGQGVGDVINNFYTEPQPTIDTTRITQSVQQIRGGPQ